MKFLQTIAKFDSYITERILKLQQPQKYIVGLVAIWFSLNGLLILMDINEGTIQADNFFYVLGNVICIGCILIVKFSKKTENIKIAIFVLEYGFVFIIGFFYYLSAIVWGIIRNEAEAHQDVILQLMHYILYYLIFIVSPFVLWIFSLFVASSIIVKHIFFDILGYRSSKAKLDE